MEHKKEDLFLNGKNIGRIIVEPPIKYNHVEFAEWLNGLDKREFRQVMKFLGRIAKEKSV